MLPSSYVLEPALTWEWTETALKVIKQSIMKPRVLLCHNSYTFRKQSPPSVCTNFPMWHGKWRDRERKGWGKKFSLPLFCFPCFEISSRHMLIGKLNRSGYKFISKAGRKKYGATSQQESEVNIIISLFSYVQNILGSFHSLCVLPAFSFHTFKTHHWKHIVVSKKLLENSPSFGKFVRHTPY